MKKIFILIYCGFLFCLVSSFGIASAQLGTNNFTVTPSASGTNDVALSWTKVEKATNYQIERDSKPIATTVDAGDKFTDTGVAQGDHKYTIVALDSSHKEIATASVEITKTATGLTIKTSPSPTPPAAPTVPSLSGFTFPTSNFHSITDLIVGVGNWLLGFAGALAVIAIVISGIMYITSGGDQSKAEAAKKNLTWAIIGLAIVLLSLVIVNVATSIVS